MSCDVCAEVHSAVMKIASCWQQEDGPVAAGKEPVGGTQAIGEL